MKEGLHFSKEFEYAVLGISMLEADAFGRTIGLIDERVFHYEDNQKVYSVIREMYNNSTPIDMMTVWQKMVEKEIVLNAGNIPWYLSVLTMNVVNSAHLEYHCQVLKKMWRKRELEKLTHSGLNPMDDERKQAYQLNERINEILEGEVKQDWYSMEELMFNLLVHQNDIQAGKKELITTGFKLIDRMNGGFSPGQMVVIGARPSVGKSALINKIAFAIAKQEKPVGIISLEMDNTQIAARLAAIDTQTSFQVVYRNLFGEEREREIFYDRLARSTTKFPIYVSDKTKVDVNEIRAKATKLKHRTGLSCLIVDYLQLVDTQTSKNQNREQEVAKLSRGFKLMAMELEIPVIVLCQLNRGITHRKAYKDRLPQLSDLRESGAIEQDADIVMMLHRDWMAGWEQDEDGNSTERQADLLGVKWRNGSLFHLPLEFNPEIMKFSEHGSNFIPVHIPKDNTDEEDPF